MTNVFGRPVYFERSDLAHPVILYDAQGNPLSYLPEQKQIIDEGQGFIVQNIERQLAGGNSIMIDGTIYFMMVPLRAGQVITNVHVFVSTAAVTASLTKVGIYSKAGVRLARSNDLGNSWQSTGLKTNALSSPLTITEDDVYYVAIVNKAGTLATLFRGSSSSSGATKLGSNPAPYGSQTGQTDLIDPATIAEGGNAIAFWVGLS